LPDLFFIFTEFSFHWLAAGHLPVLNLPAYHLTKRPADKAICRSCRQAQTPTHHPGLSEF